jgi:hypothetical protein
MKNDDDMALTVVKKQLTLGPKKSMKKNAKNYWMVEISQSIFFLCWVCSLTNLGDCEISN